MGYFVFQVEGQAMPCQGFWFRWNSCCQGYNDLNRERVRGREGRTTLPKESENLSNILIKSLDICLSVLLDNQTMNAPALLN